MQIVILNKVKDLNRKSCSVRFFEQSLRMTKEI